MTVNKASAKARSSVKNWKYVVLKSYNSFKNNMYFRWCIITYYIYVNAQ